MAQVTIYGGATILPQYRNILSTTVHRCMVEVLQIAAEKRFHRFIPLTAENFLYPEDKSERYTVIEIQFFTGRTAETKKRLLYQLMERIATDVGISQQDLEIILIEIPPAHWAVRGKTGDELT
ncbi:Tautomerase enzyme [Beggiatoa alba B18LD]|uniref:Tautomerase enzyme n=1 Tax=Beggiatoa alba B18LD TaxID=395493 RepID=I3CD65_9GAMM|nr:tautomerase family protein [Beggiatoa alba]EIJ41558.1 Tautomerase enzyme [Beggiatoa alba B18LD]